MVVRYLLKKVPFMAATIGVMFILHGNSRQFWPKIPYLSLRDESIPEHSRLLFNTLAIVRLGQGALGRLPRPRVPARVVVMGLLPILLPLLIGFGHRGLRLRGHHAERYNMLLVLLLPVAAATIEDAITAIIVASEEDATDGASGA